ncbi:MtrAB system histidine kinase MtrB [Streptomyces sp. NPDC021212]|uniref:MtrAB system histidine kinase MtrB n=1 Tax=Streptomyces sp. NPDC021212 TaxID=3365118 RepID=UPI0037994619
MTAGGTAPRPQGSGGGAPESGRVGRPDPAGDIPLFRRLWSGGHLLPDGASGGPAHPLIRLFGRWVRRPLLPAARLWRRNIQLRVVATTLLMSLGVVILLGLVVIGQVRNGLLDAKRHAAQGQAVGGFEVAEQMADRKRDGGGQDGASPGSRGAQDAGAWLNALVEQLASGGKGAYSVVALSSDSGETPYVASRGPRASGDVKADSVPADLRQRVDEGRTAPYEQYGRIQHLGSGDSEPALIIGKRLDDNHGDAYQLYYLFPFTQEEKSLSLVKGTLATAGVFVVVLLGAIAWVVVRQVVTPVRMAAGISERLAAGLLQERMKVTGEDDIARLGEAFNKMAQNLQLKIQQLEELSRMQRRFVSDVSHELRTPLTTVRMAADVIYEGREDFDPITARSAELLWGQVDRFESLLSDLLEISRFDAGAAALEADQIDLRDVVNRVVDGAEPLADAKGTRILVRGAEAPVVAEADARRVERVLRNLVVNAVEHGEGRDVVVRLAAAGGAVAVAVRDYGVGLKPGEATRVFNRFWRADPARARTTGGTGLGLSIAVEDARLHGGWLQAWGEPGGGSQFRLTLPSAAGDVLRGSPIPLEPEDSRRNRQPAEAGQAQPAAERLASVPAQPRSALPPADAPVPSADPTALPGNGARVVRGAAEPSYREHREHRERTTPNEGEGRPRGR